MLTGLLVKNVALVSEAAVSFGPGLNILTGETGAGKSIVLGALNLALGGKANTELIGRFGESAYVEATFTIESDSVRTLLADNDLEDCGDEIVISRKLMPGKSSLKINGEMVSASYVRQLTEQLLDIHGQHDHQSLLYKAHHLEILDRFAGEGMAEYKKELKVTYHSYEEALKALEGFNLKEEEKTREIGFLSYELEEIDKANLQPGEDEEVEGRYRKMVNAKRITEEAAAAYNLLGGEETSANELIGRAYSSLASVSQYDEDLQGILSEISDVDGMLSDIVRELGDYLSDLKYDEQTFYETENRLNEINRLKSKYGKTYEAIMEYHNSLQDKLSFYEDYENRKEEAEKELSAAEEKLTGLCKKVSELRKSTAPSLIQRIEEALTELNFGQVRFEMKFTELERPTANGSDEAEFMISLNPGEDLKPLSRIASGGEMSRIMLGIKSVLADQDDIETLIFDEIDTGISGRTAQAVSEKMAGLSRNHQLIAITHLPQIAAMADRHFLISKTVENNATVTRVKELSGPEMTEELGRMLGGITITKEVLDNAAQMKKMADDYKLKYQ